jgi:hypothetical protein
LEELKESHRLLVEDLRRAVRDAPSLAEREAIKLRRLEHVARLLANAPLCAGCAQWRDRLYQQEIKPIGVEQDEYRQSMGDR